MMKRGQTDMMLCVSPQGMNMSLQYWQQIGSKIRVVSLISTTYNRPTGVVDARKRYHEKRKD
jgi:hypothetical protein